MVAEKFLELLLHITGSYIYITHCYFEAIAYIKTTLTLCSHIYRHHRELLGLDTSASVAELNPSVTQTGEVTVPLTSFEPDVVETEGLTVSQTTFQPDEVETENINEEECTNDAPESGRHAAAKFLLCLREGHQISQVAIQDIVSGTRTMCHSSVEKVKEDVKKALSNACVSCESIPGLQDVLDKDYDNFEGIDTNYLYEKFCLEHFGIVVSFNWIMCFPSHNLCT